MWLSKQKIICLLLVSLFFLHFSCACQPTNVSETNPGTKKNFLWKVTSDTATVYLLGSIHVAKENLYPLSDIIESAFSASDKLVLEINMDSKTELEASQRFRDAALYDSGDSLDNHIPKELRHLLDSELEKAGMPVAFDHLKPWLISMILTMSELHRLGFDPAFGIDRHFQEKARGRKEILSLETLDEQISMFNAFSDKVQELMLRETLENMGMMDKMMKGVISVWKKGDVKGAEELLLKSKQTPEYQPLLQKVLFERNQNMTRKIEGYLKSESDYFIVVGALHLVGEKGIVKLLREKGYPVEQH